MLFDARIIDEYREVLNRPKFAFSKKMVEALIVQIQAEGILVSAEAFSQNLPDSDDEAFLEVALAIADTAIITGNSKHFPPKLCEPVRIMTPAEFVSILKSND